MGWQRGQAYGQDLRDRVLAAEGSIRAVAERFEVSDSCVTRVRSKRRRLGQDMPGEQRNHVPLRLAGLEPTLLAQVQAQPDYTLAQWCAWVQREHGVQIGVTAMWKTLGRLGLTLKKRPSTPASRTAPT